MRSNAQHYNIELAAAGIGQELIEARTLCLRAADLVSVCLDDFEAGLRGKAAQRVELGLGVLIEVETRTNTAEI